MRNFIPGVIAGLLLSLVGMSAWWYHGQTDGAVPFSSPAPRAPVHVLVLGVDERSRDTGRSDTMLLVQVPPEGPVRMLSIPRDTLVAIDGHGEGKVNSAYTYGGPELAKQTVSSLLGTPVDYYVKVNMAGFRHLVDLMGGVVMDVPRPMRYRDPFDGLVIDLKPGRQVLDGNKAEQFVRFRHDEVGDDVGRIQRQQEFLKVAAAQVLTPANLPRLPKLVYTASSSVETDLPVAERVDLAYSIYTSQQKGTLLQETLPGKGDYVDGISFFLPDRAALTQLVGDWGYSPRQP